MKRLKYTSVLWWSHWCFSSTVCSDSSEEYVINSFFLTFRWRWFNTCLFILYLPLPALDHNHLNNAALSPLGPAMALSHPHNNLGIGFNKYASLKTLGKWDCMDPRLPQPHGNLHLCKCVWKCLNTCLKMELLMWT